MLQKKRATLPPSTTQVLTKYLYNQHTQSPLIIILEYFNCLLRRQQLLSLSNTPDYFSCLIFLTFISFPNPGPILIKAHQDISIRQLGLFSSSYLGSFSFNQQIIIYSSIVTCIYQLVCLTVTGLEYDFCAKSI